MYKILDALKSFYDLTRIAFSQHSIYIPQSLILLWFPKQRIRFFFKRLVGNRGQKERGGGNRQLFPDFDFTRFRVGSCPLIERDKLEQNKLMLKTFFENVFLTPPSECL